MKKNILLPLFLLVGTTAFCQEVLKVQNGATIIVQPGAEMTVAGGVTLDNGSTLTNRGVFTIKQNGAAGPADFIDNTLGAYNYGLGTFVFNGTSKQKIYSNNDFGRINVVNAGLSLASNINASKWWLASGLVTTNNFKAIITGGTSADLEAAPSNAGFANSWINGTLRWHINPPTSKSFLFAIGDSAVHHFAELDNVQADPLVGVNYIDASFGPKSGTDAGINASENGNQYLAVNNTGVWNLIPNAASTSGAFDLKLYLDGFSGLSDNNFALLQRPAASSNAADWTVPAGSSINPPGGAGRLVSDGYALRKNLHNVSQFGIGTTTLPGQGTGLQGVYYGGINLTGAPLLTRIDPTINFELTYAHPPLSPAPGVVPDDNFSVRWTGQVQAKYSETYTFYTLSDDGVRLWVNGVKLVDNWVNQGATEKSGSITLVAGQKYDIVMEYYENTGEAVSKLLWSSASTPKTIVPQPQLFPPSAAPAAGSGLQGTYYSGINLSGTPLLTRVDTTINFELTYAHPPLSPAPGIVPEDNYSVRWTGQVLPLYSETYTFYTVSDDGIKLWVNGVKLIDNWTNHGATENSAAITLTAGTKYDIVVEYFEGTGEAVTKLLWSSASTAKAIVPKSQLFPTTGGSGLQGTYYAGINLSGAALLTRMDGTINFELTYAHPPLSPAPGIVPEDNYSVRWTGQVQPLLSETYTFYTVSDDGIRLWVNGVKLVDNWTNHGETENSGTIALVAGKKYDIVIEYYEGTGEAVTKLLWSSPGTAKAIVPKSQLYPPVNNTRAMDNSTALQATLSVDDASAFAFTTAAVSPNPVKRGQLARLQINSNRNGAAVITLLNSRGANISNQRINLVKGINTAYVSTAALAQGLYLINISGGGKPVIVKLIVD